MLDNSLREAAAERMDADAILMRLAADEIRRLRAALHEVHAEHHECIDMLGRANLKLAEFGAGPLAAEVEGLKRTSHEPVDEGPPVGNEFPNGAR